MIGWECDFEQISLEFYESGNSFRWFYIMIGIIPDSDATTAKAQCQY